MYKTREELLNQVKAHFEAGGRLLIGNRIYDARFADKFRVSKRESDMGLYFSPRKASVYVFPTHIFFIN